ncbi:hypothetical protein ABZ468_47790 [Streptomyces sp. NPDC005708]|uniref:hypothetical protein n=1 Tax=unclassified Streptomyces TaxID=2593676 RepID=UPI0033D192E6
MSQSTTAATELTSQYAAQVTSDLERNMKEQERISADITALQEQLAALRHDHSVLINVQQVLGISPAPMQHAAPHSTTVPTPRKKTSDNLESGKRTRAKKATDPQGSTATKKSAAKKPVNKTADAKTSQPTLVELVRRHLTRQSEPRSAADVATALDTANPERNIKITVVRTTLEGLVAKNHAQRNKQGASVYYTAPHTAEQTGTPADEEPQAE